jgi:hypothetical protein
VQQQLTDSICSARRRPHRLRSFAAQLRTRPCLVACIVAQRPRPNRPLRQRRISNQQTTSCNIRSTPVFGFSLGFDVKGEPSIFKHQTRTGVSCFRVFFGSAPQKWNWLARNFVTPHTPVTPPTNIDSCLIHIDCCRCASYCTSILTTRLTLHHDGSRNAQSRRNSDGGRRDGGRLAGGSIGDHGFFIQVERLPRPT